MDTLTLLAFLGVLVLFFAALNLHHRVLTLERYVKRINAALNIEWGD